MSLGIDFPGYQVGASLTEGYPREVATSSCAGGVPVNIRMSDRLFNLISPRDSFTPGSILVAAAGNESRRERDERYRIMASPPAAAEQFVSVAAVERPADVAALMRSPPSPRRRPSSGRPGSRSRRPQAGAGLSPP